MNSPVDPALLQLVQQEVKSLQDDVKNMSVEFEEGKIRVQHELERHETILEEMKQRVQRLEDRVDDFQGDCLIGEVIFTTSLNIQISVPQCLSHIVTRVNRATFKSQFTKLRTRKK